MTAAGAIMAQFQGKRFAFAGKLGGASLREAQKIVRRQGGIPVAAAEPDIDVLVLGESELPIAVSESQLDDALLAAAEQGRLQIWPETEFWRQVGRLESAPPTRRYTAAMLADLLELPVSVIRRWQRRGWLQPVEVIHRLAYFDFSQVAVARQLARLLADGMSPTTLEQKLQKLARFLPAARRSLDQLSMIVEHGELLLREERGLLGADGQWRFDFERSGNPDRSVDEEGGTVSFQDIGSTSPTHDPPPSASYRERAWELEEQDDLPSAAQWYRAALAAEGLQPDLCFQLAEVLYRLGDLGAARERYYMAVELDPDFVEARANLGCVLAESGEWELAAAALEGALQTHPDYADVHFHLANAYGHLDKREAARKHWREFLRLVPEGPWAEEARRQMAAEQTRAEPS